MLGASSYNIMCRERIIVLWCCLDHTVVVAYIPPLAFFSKMFSSTVAVRGNELQTPPVRGNELDIPEVVV